jgi:hypothetical protein
MAATHEVRYHDVVFDRERLTQFCRRNGIRQLSLFGSILRDDFGADSDIDVLVEFAPGETPSLLDLGGMLNELTEIFGRQVDLKTPGFISPRILREIRDLAQVQYAA